MVKGHQGLLFINMIHYHLDELNNTKYIDAASGFLHYLHGVNPTGFCYLSNMGSFGAEKSVPEFYNSWFCDGSSLWDRTGVSAYGPAPGFIPGGPDPGYKPDPQCATPNRVSQSNNALCDTAEVTPPLGQPVQKSFKDFNAGWPQNSWMVTENGIYYQAAYIRL